MPRIYGGKSMRFEEEEDWEEEDWDEEEEDWEEEE